jgi:hypothetical protein
MDVNWGTAIEIMRRGGTADATNSTSKTAQNQLPLFLDRRTNISTLRKEFPCRGNSFGMGQDDMGMRVGMLAAV